MSTINEQEIKDRLTKTCPCRVIKRAQIKETIRDGADTLERVKSKTGAMTGSCKGKRCSESIAQLIAQYEEEKKN